MSKWANEQMGKFLIARGEAIMAIPLNSWAEIHQATRQLPPVMKIELVRALLSEIQPDATVNTKTAADVLLLTENSERVIIDFTPFFPRRENVCPRFIRFYPP